MKQDIIMAPLKLNSLVKRGIALLALTSALIVPAFATEDLPFAISVDGKTVDENAKKSTVVDAAQDADVQLNNVDIQVKFDGLGVKPVLNVSTFPPKVNYQAGETIRFLASFNYAAWIVRGEVRVYDQRNRNADQPYQIVPISKHGAAEWQMPNNAPADMAYVLRVYDEQGRYDETKPLPLKRSETQLGINNVADKAVAPGYGEDRTATRNIPVYGGAVTVYGKNVPEGHSVTIAGEPVPIDSDNKFVVQRIFPAGKHAIDVAVLKDGLGLELSREVEIPEDEWFYVRWPI